MVNLPDGMFDRREISILEEDNHPLFGEVVAISAVYWERTNEKARARFVREPDEASGYVLYFADGRTVELKPTGWDAEGIAITNTEPKE